MKPYSRTSSIRVRNRAKYGAVLKKLRRNGFKVSNPTSYWHFFAVPTFVLKTRLRKGKGLSKHNKEQFKIDKI